MLMSIRKFTRPGFALVCAGLLCSLSLAVFAGTAAGASGNLALVQKLWNLNDDDLLLDNIKTSLITGNKNLLNGLTQKDADSIKKIVDANFVAIKAHMLQYMAQHGRSTLLTKADAWLNTPTGKKVSKMHLFARMLFTDPEAGIPVKPPTLSSERSQLQQRFISILFSDANTMQTATLGHFMALQNQTRQPEQRLGDIQLKQQINLATVSLSGITGQVLPHVFNTLFKDLSLEEVTVVMNFLDSDAGRQYDDLLVDAYLNALKATRSQTLLQISKLFNSQMAILSQYSKQKISPAQQRELMALLIKRYGKATIIRAMVEARNGQITIKAPGGELKEVYGRPSRRLVSLDTLMMDLSKSGKDIRGFYQILQQQLRGQ